MKMQYIRDEDENYEERRNKLVRVHGIVYFIVRNYQNYVTAFNM